MLIIIIIIGKGIDTDTEFWLTAYAVIMAAKNIVF